jgi:uncharacterized protein YlzI (FlbEa/FlbD family)
MKNFIEVTNSRNRNELVSVNVSKITCIESNVKDECYIYTNGKVVATKESYQEVKDKINASI